MVKNENNTFILSFNPAGVQLVFRGEMQDLLFYGEELPREMQGG
jgi:hypothetical protein